LTVNGTTTTVDTTNLNVEDPFILLGDGAQSANANAGIIFVSGSSAGSSRPDMVFGRVANDVWGLGSIASNSGSITSATSMTVDVGLRAEALQVVDANNNIGMNGSHLRVQSNSIVHLDAAASLELDSATAVIGVTGSIIPNADGSRNLGSSALEFATVNANALQSAAALDIDASSGALSLDGSSGINIGTATDVAVDIDAAALTVDASGLLMLTGSANHAAAVQVLASHANGKVLVRGKGGSLFGDDTGALVFDGSGAVTETGMASFAITPSAAITLTAGAASTWSTSAGALTLTSAAACTWSTSAGALTLNGTGGIEIQEGGTSMISIDDDRNLLIQSDVNSFKTEETFSPASDNAIDLGTSSLRWRNIYTGDLHLANERGNWTLVEESDMLTFRNNLNGKWYRMNMEEIDPTGRDDGMNGPAPVGSAISPAGDPNWEV